MSARLIFSKNSRGGTGLIFLRHTVEQPHILEHEAGRATLAARSTSIGYLKSPLQLRGDSMTSTFEKRKKEMKRLEKQRAKAERRAQGKLEKTRRTRGSVRNPCRG
jgi:hypothetical protein